MTGQASKLTSAISSAPIGALAGAVVGYFTCKKLGYDKTFSVIGFVSVGVIIGTAIAAHFKK